MNCGHLRHNKRQRKTNQSYTKALCRFRYRNCGKERERRNSNQRKRKNNENRNQTRCRYSHDKRGTEYYTADRERKDSNQRQGQNNENHNKNRSLRFSLGFLSMTAIRLQVIRWYGRITPLQ